MLIFGLQQPKLDFDYNIKSGLIIKCKNNYQIFDFTPNDLVTWRDLFIQLEPQVELEVEVSLERIVKEENFLECAIIQLDEFNNFADEKKFFRLYVEWVDQICDTWEEKLQCPALIPQAWVNWIHYDIKDEERAKRALVEPFRVDFMLTADGKTCVIEIDGSSHFSGPFVREPTEGVDFLADIDAFTTHLRKDRWLRSKGWQVYRFSNKEVKEAEDFWDFRKELGYPRGFPPIHVPF